MRECYLIMVNPGCNNNKFYKMKDDGTNLAVEYGRVGATAAHASYQSSDWNKKYREKINKGYVDQSELHLCQNTQTQPAEEQPRFAKITKLSISRLVDRLISMAKHTISHNYTVSSDVVTQEMVNRAQMIIDDLIHYQSISDFNGSLVKLFETIPRRMGDVKSYLARSANDFNSIIQKEQDLLDVMRGQIVAPVQATIPNDVQKHTQQSLTLLESLGLEINDATDSEIAMIKKKLGDSANCFKAAWKVSNSKTQNTFDKYVSDHKAKTDLLWHGSRNENWWSIVKSGLVLHPSNAVVSGHMFGIGTYFADRARKSIGYSSVNGSYWAHGSDNTGFLALYEVAVGTSYEVRNWSHELSQFNYNRLQQARKGADSLFAHSGADLRNNEIIVYREDQTTIRYLVEIN